jgi:hypothetical protein
MLNDPPNRWVLVLPPALFDWLTPEIRAQFESQYGPTDFTKATAVCSASSAMGSSRRPWSG